MQIGISGINLIVLIYFGDMSSILRFEFYGSFLPPHSQNQTIKSRSIEFYFILNKIIL